ncbi:cytochrome-c peroxidase [Rhodoferax sp. AJA081-3]|uniref:cytochrome-c peroxidase n=1 Tax=Rhodoferax sp. AJA081-3 TaxID=2752316 RepID=UPI001ADEE830|nr:cytochrome c peroxidase [Rhodoferax sp. AJA081-3]QTN26543.1 cytochrome-c peroxidase [Rhodoferax sp. AJA081-3]
MHDYRPTFWNLLQAASATALLALLSGCGGGGSASAVDAPVAVAADTTSVQADAATPPPAPVLTDDRARLGQQIFTDPNLSEPRGTACVACHQPNQGFAGNNNNGGARIGVARGSLPTSLGLRNSMTNSYQGFIPAFGFQTEGGETEAIGGHFWDGRVDTMAQQALGPFLNPLEMNNPSRRAVVDKIAASRYAPLFRQQFGTNIFNDTDAAFTQIGVAIEAFERAALQPFSSKFDAMVRGQATFTPAEARGMALFMDPARANCAGCHVMDPTTGKPEDSLFTEFTYYANGIPRNTAIPRNADPAFFDLGLCGPERTTLTLPADVVPGTTVSNFCGKFKMPTLRNVAERPAFMHNGFFNNLADVVRFYSTRNTNPQRWYGPSGVPNDLPAQYRGNIESVKAPFNRAPTAGPLLTEPEVNDVVAFLRTLSDGFRAP